MRSGTRVPGAGSGAARAVVPRVDRAGARRVCRECAERLSAYNPGPYCFAHTVGVPWNGPNQRG